MRSTEIITINSFNKLKKIGEGAYGEVFLVEKKDTKVQFALKVLEKDKILRYSKLPAVMREKDIHMMVSSHKNIVNLECTFMDASSLYFVMELAGKGVLIDLIKNVKQIPIETSRFILAELVLALEFLAGQNIAHRDLKPENILLDEGYHVKLCDFGEAKIIQPSPKEVLQKEYDDAMKKKNHKQNQKKDLDENGDEEPLELDIEDYQEDDPLEQISNGDFRFGDNFGNESDQDEDEADPFFGVLDEERVGTCMDSDDEQTEESRASVKPHLVHRGTFVGTPLYVAPEMLDRNTSGTFTDLWALGVIVYQILTGETPWKGKEFDVFQQI